MDNINSWNAYDNKFRNEKCIFDSWVTFNHYFNDGNIEVGDEIPGYGVIEEIYNPKIKKNCTTRRQIRVDRRWYPDLYFDLQYYIRNDERIGRYIRP